MIGGIMYRTDLAYEANESLAKKIEGITLNTHSYSHGEVVELPVLHVADAGILGDGIGPRPRDDAVRGALCRVEGAQPQFRRHRPGRPRAGRRRCCAGSRRRW